jgi:hypothetical protein
VGSKPSPDSLALYSIGQSQTDIYGGASEMVLVSPGLPVPQGEIRNDQVSEASPLASSDRLHCPFADNRRHLSLSSVPTFAWPVPPSLDHPPAGSTGTSRITVDPGATVDLSVFDWNSIPNPLVKPTLSMST